MEFSYNQNGSCCICAQPCGIWSPKGIWIDAASISLHFTSIYWCISCWSRLNIHVCLVLLAQCIFCVFLLYPLPYLFISLSLLFSLSHLFSLVSLSLFCFSPHNQVPQSSGWLMRNDDLTNLSSKECQTVNPYLKGMGFWYLTKSK